MTNIVQPTYILNLPSTGAKIEYRPYTVKEEKAMLLAIQEGSLDNIINSIKNLVKVCTFNTLDLSSTPYYDVEFIFLKIRSKSVGETIELMGKCDCSIDIRTDVSVDIENTRILPTPDDKNTKIVIKNTNFWAQFRHPSIDDFISLNNRELDDMEVLSRCIVAVYDEDSEVTMTPEKKLEFLESMTPIQQQDLKKFLDSMPIVELPVEYKCKGCGKDHSLVLSGFENFFV